MATRNKVTRLNIESARQELLAKAYSANSQKGVVPRQAITEMIDAVLAARESGESFDEIAATLNKYGFKLTPATVRQYFFEKKSAPEVAADARRHAQRIAKVRETAGTALLARYRQHSERNAAAHAQKLDEEAMVLVDPFKGAEGAPDPGAAFAAPRPSGAVRGGSRPKLENAPPQATARPAPMLASAPEVPRPRESEKALPVVESGSVAINAPGGERKQLEAGGGYTVDEILARSRGSEPKTEITMDIEVKPDGKVYWANGDVFEGFLMLKHAMVLRANGRLVAPTVGRTSSQVVKMRDNL